MATAKSPTAKQIWDTLSKVDVSAHTEDRGGLTYLSWAWAWGVMMEHYPDLDVKEFELYKRSKQFTNRGE